MDVGTLKLKQLRLLKRKLIKMKATIDISEYDLTSVKLTNDEDEVIEWGDLSRNQQTKLLNSFAEFYSLFSRFIKED